MSTYERGEKRTSVDEVEDKMFDKDSDNIRAAMDAGEKETEIGIKDIFKLHYPAAMWSCLLRWVSAVYVYKVLLELISPVWRSSWRVWT
jgi:hypothetical protein